MANKDQEVDTVYIEGKEGVDILFMSDPVNFVLKTYVEQTRSYTLCLLNKTGIGGEAVTDAPLLQTQGGALPLMLRHSVPGYRDSAVVDMKVTVFAVYNDTGNGHHLLEGATYTLKP